MIENLSQLTNIISSKLQRLGYTSPTTNVLYRLIEIAFFASIKTEENRFVRGSLTYSNPLNPEPHPPPCRRADYPGFTKFGERIPLNASKFVKLSRAVDIWTGSIAVYGKSPEKLYAWGIVDQQVHMNTSLHQETSRGFERPGILTINIEGVGDISIYHGNLFLGRLRQNQVIRKESDVLRSDFLFNRMAQVLRPYAEGMAKVTKGNPDYSVTSIMMEWSTSIARICIGLRRLGTGGSLLLTSNPNRKILDIVNEFPYRRAGDATILKALDCEYRHMCRDVAEEDDEMRTELGFAEADEEDRTDELTGGIKLITSLASIDGLVLMDLTLRVIGFGVKIKSGAKIGAVFDGKDFSIRGLKAKRIDIREYGMRHASMLRYCQADKDAIGIVISQDGHTRLITTSKGHLT